MAKKIVSQEKTYLSSLTENEKAEIEEKVNYELELTNYHTLKKMTLAGIVTNALTGFFVIWVLYRQINHLTLFSWYSVLIVFNIINVMWSASFGYRYTDLTVGLLKKWHRGLYFILAGLCLTWGSIGILFISKNPFYQLFVITFLQIAVLSFSFGAIFDFILALVCIGCLLLPTITYQSYVYMAAQPGVMLGEDNFLNLAFSISLSILGAFLLVVCYIGYRLTVSQATLSFLNAALNEKLDSMNQFLEQRVKERTIELENSLKLVTYQATHDLLTDLPNQRLLIEYMEAAMKLANKENHSVGVICFVINEMEKINDGLGHKSGEYVIKIVAERLQKFATKIGGDLSDNTHFTITLSRKDVFVILLSPVYQIENIDLYAEQLFFILDKPIQANKHILKLTASMGISFYPRDGKDIQTLLMNSDAAMLSAKQRGGNSLAIYNAEINADISRQLEMEQHLHAALGREEFNVEYQPFVDLKTGQICGAEVLVRWENPSLGPISPVHFIPLAEANGIIVPLGDWVLRTACRQTKIWHDMGFPSFKIAVNLSAKQLQQKDVIHIIEEILHQSGLKPEYLELELTESTAFQEDTIPLLKKMKTMGVSLSIDDFGTGYSSLSNLKSFSIDKLKIDKSFIKDVSTNNDSRTIVANTIGMAKKLNIKVLAEGVETKEQLMFLRENGCDMIQGYYFSRPIDGEAFTQLLETRAQFVVV